MASARFSRLLWPATRRIQLMSAPAENAEPAPVSMTRRTERSRASVAKHRSSSRIRASSKALRRSGRLSVTVATPRASCETSTAPMSHPEDPEMGLFNGRVEARRNRHCQHAARVLRIDDAVVPQPGAGIIGMALAFVLLADCRLEAVLLRLGPGLAARAVAPHRRQHVGRLLAAHHRDARIGPRPQEARRIGAAAHGVIAGAETAADDDREFRHVGAGDRGDHLGAVLGDAAGLVFLADHETGDVLEEDERNAALCTELYKVRSFQRALREQDA